MLIASLDNLFVTDGTAGLDNSLDAIACQRINVIAEREERIGCAYQAFCGNTHAFARLMRTFASELRRVNTVRLTRAHANPSMILRNQNRIRLNALANLPGKEHFMQFVFSGLLLSRHREL